MDSQEEQLKRRVEEHRLALMEKVNELKQRTENLKQMTDVRFLTRQRPAVMLAGSALIGFIVKKLAGGKNRRHESDGAYRSGRGYSAATSARISGRLWDPIIAITTAVATRTAIGLVNDIFQRRDESPRSRPDSRKKF